MSKNKSKELNVDFIGGQEPLTTEEQETISAFIKAQKEKASKQGQKPNSKISKKEAA